MLQSNRIPLFYIVTAIFWFSLYTYVPYVSPYSELLGADLRFIGLIVGSYGFTQMVIRFPLGILSDRLGRRKIFILAGLLFTAISGFIVYIAPHPYTMLLSRSLAGVAAASWVTFAILGASYYPPHEATRSAGYLNAANSAGRLVAFLAGGLFAQWVGVPYAFLLAGAAGIIGLIAGLFITETKPNNTKATSALKCGKNKAKKTAPPTLAELLAIARDKQLLCASFLAILTQYISFATIFGFTPLFAYGLQASQFQLGMLGMASAVPGLIASPLAGTWLPRKIGIRNTIAAGFIMTAIGCVLMSAVTNIWQLFTVQVFISTGAVVAYTLLMGLSIRDIPDNKRAAAMGFFQAVYGVGMFLGPFVMGWLGHGLGLTAAFAVTGSVGVVGLVAVIVFARRGYMAS